MEVTGWMIDYGGCAIWPLRGVLCLKTGDLLWKGIEEKTECKNYRRISLLSVVGKLYAGVVADRVRRVSGGLIDDEQRVFTAGMGCVD